MIGHVTRRPATAEDAAAILADISEITEGELLALGVPLADAPRLLVSLFAAGEVEVFCEDGKPVCLLGVRPEGLNLFVTWFLASKRFFALRAAAVLPARRVATELRKRYPAADIEAYSWSRHPQARRWFELLGFKLVRDTGIYLQFRIV